MLDSAGGGDDDRDAAVLDLQLIARAQTGRKRDLATMARTDSSETTYSTDQSGSTSPTTNEPPPVVLAAAPIAAAPIAAAPISAPPVLACSFAPVAAAPVAAVPVSAAPLPAYAVWNTVVPATAVAQR